MADLEGRPENIQPVAKPSFNHPKDVRRKGFGKLAPLADVLQWTKGDGCLSRTEKIATGKALSGRILAADVVSVVDVPDFRRAMMDGFAVSCDAIQSASPAKPVRLPVRGIAMAGKTIQNDRPHGSAEEISDDGALEIMTGAAVPDGLDAVVPFEQAEMLDDGGVASIRISAPIITGEHVAPVAEDVAYGATILSSGRLIRPQDIGLLIACAISEVEVVAVPTVQVLVTGDEIVPSMLAKRAGTICDSNGPVLEALIDQAGAVCRAVDYLSDCPSQLKAKLKTASCDVLLITGGTSVGAADFAPSVVGSLGQLQFHGVDIRPGRPVGVGRIGTTWVFLLPGNPVACLFVYELMVRPLLCRLGGRSDDWPYPKVTLRLTKSVKSKLGRVDYLRVRREGMAVVPMTSGRSSNLSTISQADGFCIIPQEISRWQAGEELSVYLFE